MRNRRLPLMYNETDGESKATESLKKEVHSFLGEGSPLMTDKSCWGWIFLFIFLLGVPLSVIYYFTPFFVVENLRCRAVGKLWGDHTVQALEEGYHRYRASPPRFPSLEYNKTMMWGTYEPGVVFAMKTRTPKPVYIGIAWYDTAGLHPVRHKMADVLSLGPSQGEGRGMISDEKSEQFGAFWAVHDGVHYGHLLVQDGLASIKIEFLKSPSGGTWHVRVHGHMDGAKPIEFLVYIVNDGGDAIELEPTSTTDNSWDPQIKSEFEDANGRREGFSLLVHDDHSTFFSAPLWRVHGWRASEGEFLRDVNLRNLPLSAHAYTLGLSGQEGWQSPKAGFEIHNVMVFSKRYESDFRVELSMRHASHLLAADQDATVHRSFIANYDALTTCQLTNAFRTREKEVLGQMRQMVTPWASGFRTNRKLYVNRARRVLSGALGAWGYWYGRYIYVEPNIDALWDEHGKAAKAPSDEQLREVAFDVSAFGAVASRVELAYGDITLTGLQLLFILHWNKEWAKDAIASWIVGAQDTNHGFIPQRAMFTAASRTFSSPSARYEHLTFAAPPTLLLALRQLLHNDLSKGEEKDFFKLLLTSLRRWRTWFHKTQSSGANEMSLEVLAATLVNSKDLNNGPRYRWRSRDDYIISASGMPDYPRPVCTGHHKLEAHVDLFSWVALLSSIISEIELYLGLTESVPKGFLTAWLDAVHWDATHQRYADRVGCPDNSFSPYVGYVNLYPLLLGLIDDKKRALALVELAKNELMTQYGMMSVSNHSLRTARRMNLRHDNHWVGNVWVSTNALMLNALRTKYIDLLGAPAEELFNQLRLFMVKTVGESHTMQDVFNPVTGASEGTLSLMGHRALFLTLLEKSPKFCEG